MVTVSDNNENINIQISFSNTISKVGLNELKINLGVSDPLRFWKSQIIESISKEIDSKFNEHFRIDSRKILND